MKEVPKKEVPEVSGGGLGWLDGSCIPDPFPPITGGEPPYPGNPGGPSIDEPHPYIDPNNLT